MINHTDEQRFYLMTLLVAGTEIVYLGMNQFLHKMFHYHPYIISLILLNLVSVIIFHFTKKYTLSSLITFSGGLVFGSLLIYAAGGIDAPGFFNFAIFLFAAGVMFGQRFMKYFLPVLFLVMGLTVWLEKTYPPVWFEFNHQLEKFINLVILMVVSYLSISIYTKQIEKKKKELTEKNQEIDNLLRIVIHDIASPLSVIKGRLPLIKSSEDKNSLKAKRAVNNVLDIINDVRRLKAASDGKVEILQEEFLVRELLEDVQEMLSEELNKKILKLELNCSSDLKIKSDRSLLKNNVLMNLMTNAIKFSHKGDKLSLAVVERNSSIDIKIIDEGEGVPAELLPDLFKHGAVTTRKGTDGESGTGFGLPIVKTVVEMLNGKISIDSHTKNDSEKSGTTFTVSLPS